MSLLESLLTIVLLIAASSFFSIAEISLAASRKLRLRQMVDEGDARAGLVIRTQEQPGEYFTVVQIGVNAVAILGGVVGEGALTPYFSGWLTPWLAPETAATVSGKGLLSKYVSETLPDRTNLSRGRTYKSVAIYSCAK